MTANEIYLRSEAEKALREADYQRGRAGRYQRENKALKSELARWSRLAEFIELPDYPVTQFKPKDLERENAQLRELVRAAWGCVKGHVSCDECRMVAGGCTLKSAMKAAGIEVE